MRSGGIWATATEEDLAKIVVNTLMESKEGYRKSPVLSSEDLSLRKQQHEEETEPAPELKGKQRTLSTSEEIKVQRESIAKEMEKHQKKKQQSQTSKTKKKSRKKSIVKENSLQKSTDSSSANTDDVFEQGGNVGHNTNKDGSKKKLKGGKSEKKTKDVKGGKNKGTKAPKANAENQPSKC